jgi:riboflavin kinase/FMN adenylyltransferase
MRGNNSPAKEAIDAKNMQVGYVVHGNKQGRKLGFPTANLELIDAKNEIQVDPANFRQGVYAAIAFLIDFQDENKFKGEIGTLKTALNTQAISALENFIIQSENLDDKETINPLPYPALLHIGDRSTFDDYKVQWEVFVVDFDGDLYHQRVLVLPLDYLRETVKFAGVEALISQMENDLNKGRQLLLR